MDPEKPMPGFFSIEEDPKFQPYLKMLRMRVPLGAVKNKMRRDGLNPKVLDQEDRSKPFEKPKGKGNRKRKVMPKKRPLLLMLMMHDAC